MKLNQHKRKKQMILQRYKEECKIIEEYGVLLKQEKDYTIPKRLRGRGILLFDGVKEFGLKQGRMK